MIVSGCLLHATLIPIYWNLACLPSLVHQPLCQRQRTSLRWIRAKSEVLPGLGKCVPSGLTAPPLEWSLSHTEAGSTCFGSPLRSTVAGVLGARLEFRRVDRFVGWCSLFQWEEPAVEVGGLNDGSAAGLLVRWVKLPECQPVHDGAPLRDWVE